ncbi:hypothetical protein ACIGPN_36675 [Streptomyces afghaniensis]|uniref:hypothetical protein n=1 Tax=Streptomyces TaxID=1883 RepID=UPI0018E598F7|nr:hypothetical protein [Streptomyces sp. Go-475]
MTLLVKSLLTCAGAVTLAVGLSLGIVHTLSAAPQQPNVPLVSFPDGTPTP